MFSKLSTTWTTGRNALLEYVLNNKIRTYKQPGYLYYIFLDDDMLNVLVGDTKWTDFENFLLEKQPSVGYISQAATFMHSHMTKGSNYTLGMFNVDANVVAFHRYTVGTLIPYDYTTDPVSIFYSAYISNMLTSAFYGSSRIGLNTIGIDATQGHRHEPDSRYKRNDNFGYTVKYMENFFKQTSVMATSFDIVNCGRNTPKGRAFYGCDFLVCGKPTKAARIEDKWMEENLNGNHSHAKNLLQWRKSYKDVLKLLYNGSSPYSVNLPLAKCP